MVTALALSLALLVPQQDKQASFDRYIDDLLRWRIQFEKVLDIRDDAIASYQEVGAETLGGGHGRAYYPLGSAAERYILSFDYPGVLVYQKRRAERAVVVWELPLVKTSSKAAVRGTMPKYLQRLGLRISPKARLTSAIRRQLAKTGDFAEYSYHHMNGGYANLVRRDGTETTVHRHDNVYMITPEEKKLLRAKRR